MTIQPSSIKPISEHPEVPSVAQLSHVSVTFGTGNTCNPVLEDITHAHPGRIVKVFPNPFAQRSPTTSIASLRLSTEFIQARQTLIESIRTDRKQESE
ncbi:MAG: hypothetical protein ACKO4R_05880 [Synechococcales cyanobacterium]